MSGSLGVAWSSYGWANSTLLQHVQDFYTVTDSYLLVMNLRHCILLTEPAKGHVDCAPNPHLTYAFVMLQCCQKNSPVCGRYSGARR